MTAEHTELAALRQAAANDPYNGQLRYLLGCEYAQQRDYLGAVLELSAAITLQPALHCARLQLGLLHLTLAQLAHAAEVLAPLEKLDDSSPFKHFKRGLEALTADDFASCVRQIQHGIALNTTNPALNANMQLICEQARIALQTHPARACEAPQSIQPRLEDVRTDFSLYGMNRH